MKFIYNSAEFINDAGHWKQKISDDLGIDCQCTTSSSSDESNTGTLIVHGEFNETQQSSIRTYLEGLGFI